MSTLYDVLGVPRNASHEAIRVAFRNAAKACHPDLHAGDPTTEQQFKALVAAYELLKRPQQRALYDQYLARSERHFLRIPRQGGLPFAVPTVAAVVSAAVVAAAVWLSLSNRQQPPSPPPAPHIAASPVIAPVDRRAAIEDGDIEALHQRSDKDRALADYEAAIRIDPNNPALLRDRGILWRRYGDLDRALVDFDRAIRMGFSDAATYNERGLVWYKKNSLDRAIADFNQALKINPKLVDALINRGNARRSKGDLDRAIADFEEAIRIDLNADAARHNRALPWSGTGGFGPATNDDDRELSSNGAA